MGSYGIGPARIVAAAIEQGADESGHRLAALDRPLAGPPRRPRQRPGEPEREAADRLYEELCEAGAEVLYDDRDAGPGRS